MDFTMPLVSLVSYDHPASLKIASDLTYIDCLSEISLQICQVQFSQTILYIVIACNVVKIALMMMILWRLNHETLVTVGDAIKSFIQRPDITTEDCCLVSRHTVEKIWREEKLHHSQRYSPRAREPWFGAVTGRRWSLSLSL